MNSKSVITVHFWGVRGSIPTPGRLTEKYGGNTSCLEVRCVQDGQETIVVIDAGSGIRELGLAWEAEFGDQSIQASLLLSHLHWDHIQGFPFFGAAYKKGNSLAVYGPNQNGAQLQDLLGGQMQEAYFPVPLAVMQDQLAFHAVDEHFTIGPLDIRTSKLPHPGGCFAFRIQAGESVLIYASDCELDQVALNAKDVGKNLTGARREYSPRFLEFFRGANLLVLDCQYTDDEYPQRIGWGHNSVAAVVDFCAQIEVDMIALTHHDPQSTDDLVSAITAEALQRYQDAGGQALVFAAREGMTLLVNKPKRPPKM